MYTYYYALLNWTESFLSDRSQSVVINLTLSGHKPCISGVPQGSVLSPYFCKFSLMTSQIVPKTHLFYSTQLDAAKLLKPRLDGFFSSKTNMLLLLGVRLGKLN